MQNHTDLPFVAASERNKGPILEVLQARLPTDGTLLEIGAGTGQHAVYMAPRVRPLNWLPSDRMPQLAALALRIQAQPSPNLLPPIALDVLTGPWPPGPFSAAYAANIAHIMPWPALLATLEGLGRCLSPGAGFFLYGPFRVSGQFTSAGNRAFDQSLRSQDPAMGLRDLAALESAAGGHHLMLEECIAMPANNLLLAWRRSGHPGGRITHER